MLGSGIRAHAAGGEIFVAQARTPGGLPKRARVDRFVDMTAEAARRRSGAVAGAGGSDGRSGGACNVNCQPATVKKCEGLLRLSEVGRSHVSALHGKLRDKPAQAKEAAGVVSRMLRLAVARGMMPTRPNPCRLLSSRCRGRSCERFLTEEESASRQWDGGNKPNGTYPLQAVSHAANSEGLMRYREKLPS